MNFGRVGFVMEGDWSAAVTYDTLSVVLYEGAVYVAKRMSAGSEPSTHPADWLMWVESPVVSAEQTENGYDLTITNGDGTTSVVHLLNGQITEAELTTALSGLREAFNANIAEGYSSSSVYSEGDYCLYNNVLYRCKTDILSPEAWDSTHWEAASLADDVQDLSENLYNNKVDAITSNASGEIVTISDGGNDLPVVDLKVSLLPVQDLHGQDAPYPPGGGANKFNPNTATNGYIKTNGTMNAQTASKEVTSDYIPLGAETKLSAGYYGYSSGEEGWVAIGWFDSNQDFIKRDAMVLDSYTFTIPSGAVYARVSVRTFDHGAQGCFASFGTVTSFSPYSNICLISGWTGVEVYQSRKNFCHLAYISSSNALYDNRTDNSVRVYSTSSSASYKYCKFSVVSTDKLRGKVVTFSCSVTNDTGSATPRTIGRFVDSNNSNIGSNIFETTVLSIKQTFTVPTTLPDGAKFCLYLYSDSGTGGEQYKTWSNIQLELGSEQTSFEPYNGNTYPISWQSEAGTVYGGSLDLTTGVLTVDSAKDSALLSSYSQKYTGETYDLYVFNPFTSYIPEYPASQISNLVPYSLSTGQTLHFYVSNNRKLQAYLPKDIDLTQTIEVCYPLATPLTFQLSETQIATYLGVNNFWSNSNGQIDLEYRCDTKLYIEQLTKPSEDDMVANANIASGKFFMVGNRLMLSTTAIAQGEQIVVGTNCSEVSLADALNQINS